MSRKKEYFPAEIKERNSLSSSLEITSHLSTVLNKNKRARKQREREKKSVWKRRVGNNDYFHTSQLIFFLWLFSAATIADRNSVRDGHIALKIFLP